MRQKCIPLPHRQPQVNVMNLCFCITDVIFNVNETSLFRKTKQMSYIHLLKYCPNIILYQIQDSFQILEMLYIIEYYL